MRDLVKIASLFKTHFGWLLAGLILCLITVFANIGLLSTSGWFITSSAIAGLIAVKAADDYNIHGPGAAVRGFALLRTISRYGERIVTHEATFRVLAELRLWIFAKLLPLTPARLGKYRSGDLLNRMTADVDTLDKLYLSLFVPTVLALAAACAFAGITAFYLPSMLPYFLLILVVSIALLPYWSYKEGYKASQETLLQTSKLRTALIDHCQGLADLVTNQADKASLSHLTTAHTKLLQAQIDEHQVQTQAQMITLFLTSFVIFLFLTTGLPAALNEGLPLSLLALLILGVMAVMEATAPLAAAFQKMAQTQMAARRILDVSETEPAISTPDAPALYPSKVQEIRFEKCCFSYPNRHSPALKDISLTLKAGEHIGLIGDSGSGKSTFMSLLMRFIDPTEGTVSLNQTTLSELSFEEIVKHHGYLDQKTHLFNATLRDNLMIANPEASDQDLIQALFRVGLKDLYQNLPNGLESWLGEHGSRVSGGQARRIALARLLLRPTELYLIDEPTEGLDRETEADIMDELLKEADGKTLILSTHRHRSLAQMDRILIFKEGRFIKECTFDTLDKTFL